MLNLSFLQKIDIPQAARVLGRAMLTAPLHVAVFQGRGETELKKIEDMCGLRLRDLPGITFLARTESDIVGVMRMKTCEGRKMSNEGVEDQKPSSLDGPSAFDYFVMNAAYDPKKDRCNSLTHRMNKTILKMIRILLPLSRLLMMRAPAWPPAKEATAAGRMNFQSISAMDA